MLLSAVPSHRILHKWIELFDHCSFLYYKDHQNLCLIVLFLVLDLSGVRCLFEEAISYRHNSPRSFDIAKDASLMNTLISQSAEHTMNSHCTTKTVYLVSGKCKLISTCNSGKSMYSLI